MNDNRCPKCGTGRRNLVPMNFPDNRTGIICKKCGWNEKDIVSLTYTMSCGECQKDLGRVDLREGVTPKTYICHECSAVRVKEDRHDPDNALARFPLFCAYGCGKQLAWNDHEEGKYASIDELSSVAMSCDGQECVAKREDQVRIAANMKAVDNLASKVAR